MQPREPPCKSLPVEPGDRIRLNHKAREWTRGRTFTVEEVKSWGVVCSYMTVSGTAFYRATWDEIEEPA